MVYAAYNPSVTTTRTVNGSPEPDSYRLDALPADCVFAISLVRARRLCRGSARVVVGRVGFVVSGITGWNVTAGPVGTCAGMPARIGWGRWSC